LPERRTEMSAILFSILGLAAIGWVLHVNAADRRILEKELDDEFRPGQDGQA